MTSFQQSVRIILHSVLYDRAAASICLQGALDTGAGIDPEIMDRLFSKFAPKAHNCTGLGLYILKTIIEAHGGKIWAENNKDGSGATFSFTLRLLSRKE
jgi:signal transduction histidine kinase